MGGQHSHSSESKPDSMPEISIRRKSSAKIPSTAYTPALEQLFKKLELTAETDNGHPGEITKTTFENVFHGPLHLFGKLLYRQMVTVGNHSTDKVKERISCEQFVKAGREVLKLFDETEQHKYYFKLFAEGKGYLTRDETLKMINIAYALTLSSTMIPYVKGPKDDKVFEAVVESIFGMKSEVKFGELEKWLDQNCPHMFSGVHNWVYTILTGSKMPYELEAAPVPLLDKFTEGKHCMTMGMLWMLTATLPYLYTHTEQDAQQQSSSASGTKNPLLTSYQLLMKLARLSRCQSWTTLYDSDEHGLSMNRFNHHITAYKDPTVTLLSFEGRNLYCVALDVPWREGTSVMGRDDTQLVQITPIYRVIKAHGPMVLWNENDRNLPQGIHIAQTGKTANVLGIPLGFDKIKLYGVECELQRVEMWGCGGLASYQSQQKQKMWEKKEVEKHKSRKLRLDTNWDENPDKQLLSWGGIEVNHQYSRNGGM